MQRTSNLFACLLIALVFPVVSRSATVEPQSSIDTMPVKEITVFKDGHSFVLHQGKMPTNDQGDVVLDYLPRPIIGTFWTYSADAKAKLTSVHSGRQVASIRKTALTIPELIRANIGAKVCVTEPDKEAYEAVILGVPTRSSEELDRTSPPSAEQTLAQHGQVVLLQIGTATKVLPIARIQDITFVDRISHDLPVDEFRNMMTLKFDWNGRRHAQTVEVGMTYVERGIRWIPSYRVDIDGQGKAKIKLQATLVNELLDLEDVTAHLVVGVPTFKFEETPDPISLQKTVAQLSSHLRQDSRTAYSFSNAIASQMIAPAPVQSSRQAESAVDLGSDVAASGKNEDLYVFTVENITLEKGGRMVVPIAEYGLEYEDLFVVDLPPCPPPEARMNFNSQQQAELARLFHAPKAMHKIRLTNDTQSPLTTAPALILRQGRVIAQGMMTYTAVGAACDLELTTAVDISVSSIDRETGRTPNAAKFDGSSFTKTALDGVITITNRKSEEVNLEVCRSVLGHMDETTHDGRIEQLAGFNTVWMVDYGRPFWWDWYSWPYWWHHFNGFGRVTWECSLEPSKDIELEYHWHYFWRQ